MATGFVGANTSGVYGTPSAAPADVGQLAGLNDRVETYDGKRWVFVSASTSVTSYQVVAIDSQGYAQAITSALAQAGNRVGVAQNNISSGSYGWVQTFGPCSVAVLSTCSSNTVLYTSATAGSLDDTATSQIKIAGITILANVTAAGTAAGFMATEPFAAL